MIFDKYRFVVFSMLLISGATTLAADEACDLRSLDGYYEFSASGKTIPTKATDSGELEISSYELRNLTVTGTLGADGAGNVTIHQTRVSQGLPHQDEEILGTYTVNSDCTGKISFLPDDGNPPQLAATTSYSSKPENSASSAFRATP